MKRMNYKAKLDLPQFARDSKILSPSKLAQMVLNRRNKKITSESITMWFKRHPQVYDELSKELVQGLPTEKQAVDQSIFENGNFQEIPSVKRWIQDLTLRNAKESTIKAWLNALKRVCRGQVQDGVLIRDWSLKHPDRLTLQEAKDFLFEVKKRNLRMREWALMLRNFLTSGREIIVRNTDISGKLEDDAGQYADLYVSKERIYEIFDYLNDRNHMAYLISKFSYKTASRLTASLEAQWAFLNHEERTITVFEKAIKGKAKRKCMKLLSEDLYIELLELEPKQGKIFKGLEAQELNKVLREAYRVVIPDIAQRIPKPFHFWRHMFAQHMLRASNWNYGLVASLGHWSLEALRRYYGLPPREELRKFGLATLPRI
jgi:integrase